MQATGQKILGGSLKRSGVSIQGLLVGGFTAGVLSVVAGFFMAQWLMPESNLGPILGCLVAPEAAMVGAILGWIILVAPVMPLPGAILLGLLTGLGLVLLGYRRNLGSLDSFEGAVSLLAALSVFGLTGVNAWLVRATGMKDPEGK